MSALTTRLSLYKPGGGSSGLILPDEAADIDKINGNMDLIDSAIGAFICTSGTRPAVPFNGQTIFETDTARIRVWRASTSAWVAPSTERGTLTNYIVPDLATLDTIADAIVGDTVRFSAAPSTGITFEGLTMQAVSGTGAAVRWQITSTVVAATKANLATFIAALVAITDLNTPFIVGNTGWIIGTNSTLRFTTTAGAYRFSEGLVPIVPTSVAGTGVTLGANGVVTFAAATSGSINGCFTADFDNYDLVVNVTTKSAAANANVRLRSAGTDITAANYNTIQSYATVSTPSATTVTGGTSFATDAGGLAQVRSRLTLYSPFLAAPTGLVGSAVLGSAIYFLNMGGDHTLSTSYDGFTLFPGSGTVTLTVRVYGYNNN